MRATPGLFSELSYNGVGDPYDDVALQRMYKPTADPPDIHTTPSTTNANFSMYQFTAPAPPAGPPLLCLCATTQRQGRQAGGD